MAQIRLDKYFSSLGILTRSECKKAVKEGKIKVNGIIATNTNNKVDEKNDQIEYNNEVIAYEKNEYFMLHKPKGVVSATEDNLHKTVLDLIKEKRPNLFPVGRLDIDTEGLLLITNDGELSHRLLSPKNHIEKTYEAKIDGRLTKESIQLLENGIDIGEKNVTKPAKVMVLKEEKESYVSITITEGKFHQVKRMFQAVGTPVLYLKRISMGSLKLDESLQLGEYRKLTDSEIEYLKKTAWKQD